MTPAARVQAAILLLDEILAGTPAEQALTGWARRARFAGSKDRAAVRDHVFDAVRCRRSFAALGGAMTGRGLMLGALRSQGAELGALFDGSTYGPDRIAAGEEGHCPKPGAEAGDIPDWLWPAFQDSLGAEVAAGAAYLRQRAPVFVRVNTKRADREGLIRRLAEDGIEARPHTTAATALEITQGARRLRNTTAFQDGCFEMQDVASQAVVAALPLADGRQVLDFCAGGGGKTLAMGARADIALTAHDSDPRRMRDLPARAERAGLRVTLTDSGTMEGSTPYDLVLCDVPCSGSGSWRRAPDGKWALTPDRLQTLMQTQDSILDRACALVAGQGTLAYATCSVLRAENEDRIDAFLARCPDWQGTLSRRWPLTGGGDGFFLTLLTRR
ncbi:RsmB/NOP family class I SAM-dependent RNA methyltransferase [Aestuariivita sp.]|jgi:16S rRNA (cytosine967-C5)-methyltransferase|uniref:RsmB/NOP family class I SAM-dependent RNA methyltransferase n=1 Tax=Aestuariivita sp. TaxID=1872407 RepID=UPI002173DE0C|nr:RsmB/NOP family class I SAM-dependent RNA methyltransferase [Aestuariivita sp.]MCE8008225.1 RsmB/NOP family class I SAM-dependent RNA methyltransferase [Aestuariivita sp.]